MPQNKGQFIRLAKSKSFATQEKAVEWADTIAKQYEDQGVSTRTDVDFQSNTSRWKAKVFVKATGESSIEKL